MLVLYFQLGGVDLLVDFSLLVVEVGKLLFCVGMLDVLMLQVILVVLGS